MGGKANFWLGTTVRGKENSREGDKGPTCGCIWEWNKGHKPHGTKWKEKVETGLWVDMLELWLCVLLRIFLWLTCGYVYLRIFMCQSCGCRLKGFRWDVWGFIACVSLCNVAVTLEGAWVWGYCCVWGLLKLWGPVEDWLTTTPWLELPSDIWLSGLSNIHLVDKSHK